MNKLEIIAWVLLIIGFLLILTGVYGVYRKKGDGAGKLPKTTGTSHDVSHSTKEGASSEIIDKMRSDTRLQERIRNPDDKVIRNVNLVSK